MPSRKPKHLFISHSSEDVDAAMTICGVLQRAGLTTWIAPRDLKPGKWQGGLSEAISTAGAVVLLWSRKSDRSEQVAKELVWAENAKVDILPLQLEVFSGGALEYVLKPLQWFPAFDSAGRLRAKLIVSAAKDMLAGRDARTSSPTLSAAR
jgi:TIR domain